MTEQDLHGPQLHLAQLGDGGGSSAGIARNGNGRKQRQSRGEIIAFIEEGEVIREILTHLGKPVDPPHIAPARGPPLWEAAGQCGDDLLIQPLPEYEFDQRIAW